jgi:glycyl-tRNA synthetase beta chain
VAFDAEGKATKACLGFARSRQVPVEDLIRITTTKGQVVGLRRKLKGQACKDVLPEVVVEALEGLKFPKTMRWGEGIFQFARPVHWIVCLLDDNVLALKFLGISSDRYSRGHRFSHPDAFFVDSMASFPSQLKARDVLVHPETRKALIVEKSSLLAAQVGGRIVKDKGLEEETTFLTEFPLPLLGEFSEEFLQLPRPVLIAAMRNHQRYFSIEDEKGQLKNAFVAVSNTPVQDNDVVLGGYERVLTARLSDARFFYQLDQKRKPDEMVADLQDILFQADLGSYYEKTIRIANLAVDVSGQAGLGKAHLFNRVIEALTFKMEDLSDPAERFSCRVAKAALLAKTDLLTEMVGEFPELQGVMGGEYARLAGESNELCLAIKEQYYPRFSGDILPSGDEGAILSISDRLDTMAGCFGVGLRPTGGADPYALRRQCLGVIAIVLGKGYRISLRELIFQAVDGVADKIEAALLKKAQKKARKKSAKNEATTELPPSVGPFKKKLVDDLMAFFEGRLRIRLGESAPVDVVDAVLASGWDDLVETKMKVDALASFSRQSAFEDLAVAFKRVINIIKDFGGGQVDSRLLSVEAEKRLHQVFIETAPKFNDFFESDRFDEVLDLLARKFRSPVDEFFSEVMVNDPEDPTRQTNRKALLTDIAGLFGRIADFSRLQTAKDKAELN